MNDLCFCLSYDLGEFFYGCVFDAFDGFEMGEEHFFCFRSDAFYVVEFRMQGVFASFVSMECDGESVHLVLNSCEYMEQFALGFHADDHRREAEEQFVGAVFPVFGESCDGDAKVQFILYDLSDDLHLSFSAVGDDEVG